MPKKPPVPDIAESRRPWRPRFETPARVALVALTDELAAARRAAEEGAEGTLHLAGLRDAIDRVAESAADPAIRRACDLFDRLVGHGGIAARQRMAAAQLALETLTLLLLSEPPERQAPEYQARAAAALDRLEQAMQAL